MVQDNSVRDVVLGFLNSKGQSMGGNIEEQLKCEYLDVGILDSMGIVEMIAHLEDTFQIRFSAEELQSEEFRTPAGIVRIIQRYKGAS